MDRSTENTFIIIIIIIIIVIITIIITFIIVIIIDILYYRAEKVLKRAEGTVRVQLFQFESNIDFKKDLLIDLRMTAWILATCQIAINVCVKKLSKWEKGKSIQIEKHTYVNVLFTNYARTIPFIWSVRNFSINQR